MAAFASCDVQYEKDNQLKSEDVAVLEEWQRDQPHLPDPLDLECALFLHSCYYNIENAKERIDKYYTIRTQFPDIFTKLDPFHTDVQQTLNALVFVALPDLTTEGNAVWYVRLSNCNPNVFDFDTTLKVCDMVFHVLLKKVGCGNGQVLVVDLKGASLRHLLKCSLRSIKMSLAYLQTALPLRIKSLHFVNAVSFMDKIFALIKPLMSKQFQDKLHVHYGDNSTIFNFVEEDILPIDCGGSGISATDYYNNVILKEFTSYANYFKEAGDRLADESKRPGTSTKTGRFFSRSFSFKWKQNFA